VYLEETNISCGICELVHVGEGCAATLKNLINKATNGVKDVWGDGEDEYEWEETPHALMIASLTEKQKRCIRLLENHGFRRVGRWKKNPNSDNRIALFVKRL
jgi:hypothetical protein